MSEIFLILIFNLILFFIILYISQNYKVLFSKLDSLTFKINYINIVFLSFIPILESSLIKYHRNDYIFLLLYFIIYIVFSIKFSFLKRTTVLCITVPYLFFYKIPELIVGEVGILLIFSLNFIQSFIQYKKNNKEKAALFSIALLILILSFLFLRKLYWNYYFNNLLY